ncbi:hypothetical protein BT69DRAFT_179209 [Atractiella rhizophila]|nr:hypothetical protein BT69DRAFT_179209 [Atractiella rhizophila]
MLRVLWIVVDGIGFGFIVLNVGKGKSWHDVQSLASGIKEHRHSKAVRVKRISFRYR